MLISQKCDSFCVMWLLQIWLAIFDSFKKKKKVYQVVKEFVQIKSILTFIFFASICQRNSNLTCLMPGYKVLQKPTKHIYFLILLRICLTYCFLDFYFVLSQIEAKQKLPNSPLKQWFPTTVPGPKVLPKNQFYGWCCIILQYLWTFIDF